MNTEFLILSIITFLVGAIIAWFAAGENYIALAIATLIGAAIGYAIGKNMEQAAKN